MTTAELQTTSVNKTANRNKDTLRLLGLVFLYSMLVCMWSLSVGHRVSPVSQTNEVELAASELGEDLLLVTVPTRRFGQVGLCDFAVKDRPQIQGVNSLSANRRSIANIAQAMNFAYMTAYLKDDIKELNASKSELFEALKHAISPNYYSDLADGTRRSLYERAYKTIEKGAVNDGRNLVDLKIQFTRLKSSLSSSQTFSCLLAGQSLSYDDGNFYRTRVDVPVPGCENVSFYELSPELKLASLSDIAVDHTESASSVVRLDATFESVEKGGLQKLITRETAIVCVGAPRTPAPATACLVSFPSGKIAAINCMKDLFDANFDEKKGNWYQSVESPVPGAGHLAPPLGLERGETNCAEALQLSLYHWLCTMGQHLEPENARKALLSPFEKPPDSAVELRVNSALVRNTGAPTFALLYQSKPGGQGQEVLRKAFSAAAPDLPRTALPVLVDEQGRCMMPGTGPFDLAFVRTFLSDLQKTNLAALESRSVAHTVFMRMTEAVSRSQLKLESLKSELGSLQRSMAQRSESRSETQPDRSEHLNRSIQLELSTSKRCERIKRRAAIAEANASRAALISFQIASDLKQEGQSGIFKVEGPLSGYLLNRSEVFVPHTEALSEEDLYDDEIETNENIMNWTSNTFTIKSEAYENSTVGGVPIIDFWRNSPKQEATKPVFVLLPGKEIYRKGTGRLRYAGVSPYAGTGVTKNQLLFYGSNSLLTGDSPKAGWSCLIRDLVAFKDRDSHEIPLPAATQPGAGDEAGPLPGLALELQIRSPVPMLKDLPGGFTVLNADTRESVNLIPPAPADML